MDFTDYGVILTDLFLKYLYIYPRFSNKRDTCNGTWDFVDLIYRILQSSQNSHNNIVPLYESR